MGFRFWEVPNILGKQGIHLKICKRLGLEPKFNPKITKWARLHNHITKLKLLKPVTIVICGKYVENTDTYYSVMKALTDASYSAERNLEIDWLDSNIVDANNENATKEAMDDFWVRIKKADGILVPGGK